MKTYPNYYIIPRRVCPKCHQPLQVVTKRNAQNPGTPQFAGCMGWPQCGYRVKLSEQMKADLDDEIVNMAELEVDF